MWCDLCEFRRSLIPSVASADEDSVRFKLALFSRIEHDFTSSSRVRTVCLRFCETEVGNRERQSKRVNRKAIPNVRSVESRQQNSIQPLDVAEFDSANHIEIAPARGVVLGCRASMRLRRNSIL